jgi:hypothetical protein
MTQKYLGSSDEEEAAILHAASLMPYQEGHIVKHLMLLSLVVLFMASPVFADGRRHREPRQGSPFADEMVEGAYDKGGRCEVRCERTHGWAYQCRSYRC